MTSYRTTLSALSSAQKGAARGAPAYSRFVNRKLGRVLAAAAIRFGLSPNAVTGISACFTFAGIVLLALNPPSVWLGVTVAALLVVGYAFDSADGQVARHTGRGGPAGEWLDHVVDSVKVVTLPLALLVQWYRFDVVSEGWLTVPLAACVIASVSFLAMILTEQLRRARGVKSTAATGGRSAWIRPLVAVPTDYGVLCLSFLLLGVSTAFVWIYAAITAYSALYLALSLGKWFRELSAWR
jgi:phosphatidylglycerophosphate synthase